MASSKDEEEEKLTMGQKITGLSADIGNDILGGIGKAISAVGGQVKEFVTDSTTSFMDFEHQMETVFAQMPGATAEDMARMSDQVLDFSRDCGVLPEEVIPALSQALADGVPQETVFDKLAISFGTASDENVKNMDILNAKWETMKIELGEKLLPVLIQLGDKLMKLFEENKPAIDKLIDSLAKFAVDCGSKLLDFATSVMPVLLDAFQWVVDHGDIILAALLGVAAGFIAIAIATAPISAPLMLLTLIIMGIVTAITFLAMNWQTIWQNISDFFINVWNTISGFFTGVWNGIVVWFTEQLENVAEFFTGIWQGISDFFTTIWNSISGFFTELWNGIVEWFMGSVGAVAEFWNGIWQGISDFFMTIWNTISEFFMNIWNGIVAWFTEQATAYVELWNSIWQGISDFFMTIWNTISEFFINIWNGLVEWFMSAASSLSAFWNGIWQEISDFFISIWNGISSFFSGIWNGIVGWFTSSLNSVSTVFSSIWNGVSGTFINIWNNIKGVFETVWNSITGMFSNVGSWFADIGKNIVSGIWNGISSMVDWIKDKIMGFASSVTDWFKGFFGIASPSKLMRDMIGKNLALGISVGFTDNIDDVFSDMETSVGYNMDKLIGDSGNLSVQGQQVTNNDNGVTLGPIIIQQPVASPAETARAIKREAVAILG